MPEINVNCLVYKLDPFELSASVAERGPNAGEETWANAKAAARSLKLDSNDIEALREFFSGFGAWAEEECASWSNTEVKALTLQYFAGNLRELQSVCPGEGVGEIDWAEAEKLAERGTVSDNLFVHNGELWATLWMS
jgi:hypothetical protein